MSTAKVFWSGNSQAIRLPREFRFPEETQEVSVRREGERLILEPLDAEEWPEEFWQSFGAMPEDFDRPSQTSQLREPLDA